jgi:hypothetical protein
MTINIGQWTFHGLFGSTDGLLPRSGVYVILGSSNQGARWDVVDVGESSDLRQRVSTHDRLPCWRGQGYAELTVASFYCDERARMAVESRLRSVFNPPCGER